MTRLSLPALIMVLVALRLSSAQKKPCPSGTLQQKPRVTVPSEYMNEGKFFHVKCSTNTQNITPTLGLWWAVYRGFYFTPLDPNDYSAVITRTPNNPQGCGNSLISTLRMRMTEDKDGILLTCFTYDITATPNQIECSQNNKTCTHGNPLRMFRSWPLFNLEGKVAIVLVAGWALVIFPIVIYLLWTNTRVLQPSKLVDMGDSGHAKVTLH
ncbi:hypothetical protein RRG08_060560 [Elysia crispata]|uniref:Uncharacterized protein n=1 Tax=Elysia crispata TaxID=231223 RepID=A0AAE1ANQ2_9GAST|nr:hypothetical protein RRG08_060560 [Elysia crispata]